MKRLLLSDMFITILAFTTCVAVDLLFYHYDLISVRTFNLFLGISIGRYIWGYNFFSKSK